MLRKLLVKLFAATFYGCLLCSTNAIAQSYDQTNNPRQYYFNPFTSATPATPSTYFPGGGSVRSANATIGMVSTGGISGNTLSSLALNQVGYLQWSFMSNTGAGGVGLGNSVWEWEFDYKNVGGTVAPGDATNNITASTSAATDSWRYWLISSSYVATNSTLGLFVTVSGTNLKILTRYNAANTPLENVSIPLPLSTDTYQIRIVKNATGAYFIFVLNKTTNVLSTYNNGGGGYNIGNSNTVDLNTYNYSFLECSTTTANRFQWDNFNFYQQKLEYIPITGVENGITTVVYPGIVDAIPYGVNVNIRGDIMLGRFVCKATGDSQALYESGALWKTTNSVLSTASPATKITDLSVYNNGTSQVNLPSSERYYSTGNGDGNTANVINYFLVLKGRNPFYSSFPTSLAWSVSTTADDNYSLPYTNSITPINPTTAGTTAPAAPSGNVYDWKGSNNSSWTAGVNWRRNFDNSSNQAPNSSSDIVRIGVVAYTGSNQPSVTATRTMSVLQIGNLGSTATTTAPVNLDMGGFNLTANNGLIVNENATLNLTNTSSTNSTINVAGNSSVAATGIINFPTATSGVTIANTGTFTLASNANGSAAIGKMNAASSITGNVNVQRYFTGGATTSRGYRFISSPVSVSSSNLIYPNLTYIAAKTYTTGTNGISGGFDAAGNPTFYLYRENMVPNSSSFISGNYRGVSSISGGSSLTIDGDAGTFTLPAGNGVLAFFRGDKATTTSPTNTASIAQPTTFTASGYLNQGTISVKSWVAPTSNTLLYTSNIANSVVRGFNLVGNPYACSIDWDKWGTSITGNNVSNIIYVYNPTLKVYAIYMAGSGGIGTNFKSNSGANIIPSGQGFLVRATAANPTLTFTEDAKTSSQVSSSNLLMSTQPVAAAPVLQYMRLRLSKDELNADESLIFFKQDAKPEFVVNEDAEYLKGNSILNISTLSSENASLGINKLPFTNKEQSIPLNVNITSTGLYTISLTEIRNIPKMFDAWLMDAYKKDSLDIKNNKTYNFNAIITDPASFGINRFRLVIRPNKAYMYRLLDFAATKQAVEVKLNWKVENEQNYTYFTLERSTNGGKTFEIIGSSVGNNLSTYSLTDKAPVSGENLYRLKQEDYFGSITYSKVVPVMYTPKAEGSLANVNVLVYPNPTSTNLNVAVNKSSEKAALYKITITNSSGLNIKTVQTSRSEWSGYIGDLLPGNYFLQVVDSNNNSVIGNSKFVKL